MDQALKEDIVDVKNHMGRQFNNLTSNFYLMKACVRYYSVKKGVSFTSSDVSTDFPLNVPVAGSCLKALDELGVVESRGSHPRYMPDKTDIERMEDIGEILRDSHEIRNFKDSKN
jgi:hypothetical protein